MKKLLAVLGLIVSLNLYSADVEPLESWHVHEAFMNKEASVTLLTAIPMEPPPPLREKVPQRRDRESVWVEGYWEWSPQRSEFVWCSGAWRRPPPDHSWIAGSWKRVNEGWIRVKGFWSKERASRLDYIEQTPPDPYDENPSNRPGDDYFWMAGYWLYENGEYVWYSGKWEELDRDWVYVPPKYVWRPDGYHFVPAFWDWPLDERGVAYACVAVPPGQTSIEYDRSLIIEPIELIEGCILIYPDYFYFYAHYCHFHYDWWIGCPRCPPWWGWDWWWMPWCDHWGLWWWWCHPGYAAPWWLDPWYIGMMFGPPSPLLLAIENVEPPPIIGPNGLIPPGDLIDAAEGVPIFPENPIEIQKEAGKGIPEGSTKRPSGPHKPSRDTLPPPQSTPAPSSDAEVGEQPPLPSTKPDQVQTPPKPSQPPSYEPRPVYPEPSPRPAPRPAPSYRPRQPHWHDHGRRPPRQPHYRPQPQPHYQPPRRPQWNDDSAPTTPLYPSKPRQIQPSRPQPRRTIPYTPPRTTKPYTPPRTTRPYTPPQSQQVY